MTNTNGNFELAAHSENRCISQVYVKFSQIALLLRSLGTIKFQNPQVCLSQTKISTEVCPGNRMTSPLRLSISNFKTLRMACYS